MKLKYYLMAIRPKTLTAGITPVIIGLSFSFYDLGKLNILTALMTIFCTFLMQMGTNLVNDYFDFKKGTDANRSSGPVRVTQTKLLSVDEVKWGYRICFTLAFLLGIYLMMIGGKVIIILGLSSLVMAYAYTGGPIPLAYYALGELLALIFFGPVAVFGTYYIQALQFNIWPIIIGLSPGLLSAALMAINNLRDRMDDKKSGKYTLANIFSEPVARLLPFLFIVLGSVILPFYMVFHSFPFAVLVSLFPFLMFKKTWMDIFTTNIDGSLNLVLAKIGQYLFFYGILLSIGMHVQL